MPAVLRFPYGSPDDPVSLASHKNSLGRYSQRTHVRRSKPFRVLRRLRAHTACYKLISSPLHLPSGVLCSFRSRYYYAIGLGECLGLEACASQIQAQFPMRRTLDTRKSPVQIPLRDYHPLWCLVPEDFEFYTQGVLQVRNSTSRHHFGADSVCPFPCSIAFTSGISVDFFSSAY